MFYEHVSVDSEEIRRCFKAPLFQLNTSFHFCIVFGAAGRDAQS